MRAGDYENNREVVEMVIKEGRPFPWDCRMGRKFWQKEDGEFKLGREGGHTEFRIVHHKDITGAEIERALLEYCNKSKNIQILDYHYVIDLITQHHIPNKNFDLENISCYGAYVLDQKK